MNASPIDRTPGAGRQAYFSAGMASESARNLLCKESRSSTNCLRTASACSRSGTACADATAAVVASAQTRTAAVVRTERQRPRVVNAYGMAEILGGGRGNGVRPILAEGFLCGS